MKEFPTITAYTKEDFRAWLEKHGGNERRVAVILHKRHTGKSAPTHRELIEEAICHGWIDTTIKRLDEATFMRNFAKRSKNSRWSDNTLAYAQRLIKEGKMTEQGLYFYKLGLARPTHDHGIPKNPDMPAELKTVLSMNAKAKKNFELFPPSAKRMFYRWLLHAKLPATRDKRVKQIIAAAIANQKNFLRPSEQANN